MSYYEEIFTRLNKATTVDEVVAIRDAAKVARIKARLAGDLLTETLAADIVVRANQKSLSFDSHHGIARHAAAQDLGTAALVGDEPALRALRKR